jgi:alpha-L-fucosidase
MPGVPNYLRDLSPLYHGDPRRCARTWFCDARFGLFLHYGLYSLLGRHEWVQFRERIPVASPWEIGTTMCTGWGYRESERGRHKGVDEVWETLRNARQAGFNLLLNSAPRPDGALDPEDTEALLEIGERLRREGFPGDQVPREGG